MNLISCEDANASVQIGPSSLLQSQKNLSKLLKDKKKKVS